MSDVVNAGPVGPPLLQLATTRVTRRRPRGEDEWVVIAAGSYVMKQGPEIGALLQEKVECLTFL